MLMSVKVNFIENIFRSRLTLVSSNDIITIKIKKLTNVKNNKKKRVSQREKSKRTIRSYDMQNDHLQRFSF